MNLAFEPALLTKTIEFEDVPHESMHFIKNNHSITLLEDDFFKSNTIFCSLHQSKWNNKVHNHDFFELVYVLRGTAEMFINGISVQLYNGEACLLNPSAFHSVNNFDDTDTLLLNICISKKLISLTYSQLLIKSNHLENFFFIKKPGKLTFEQVPYIVFHHLDNELIQIVELLVQEFLLPDTLLNRVLINQLSAIFLSLIIRQFRPNNFKIQVNKKDLLIMNYMTENFSHISLKELADHFHYHPKYFSQYLIKSTGKTFSQILKELKLENAVFMLENSDETIEEIISLCGYNNKSYFYKIFFDKFNMSPGEYRKKYH